MSDITTPEQMREAAARCCDEYYKFAPTGLEAEILDAQLEFTADRIRAIPIAPRPVVVTVKPLVWHRFSGSRYEERYEAETAAGRYAVINGPVGWTVWRNGRCLGDQPHGVRIGHKDSDAAKAAAQAHHDSTVQAMIDATSARDVRAAALREALAAAREAGIDACCAAILALIDKKAGHG